MNDLQPLRDMVPTVGEEGPALVMSRKASILLYEANQTILRMMKFNLEMEGFIVVEAGDPAEVTRQVAEQELDLVLLNWTEPGEGGVELCRAVRRSDGVGYLPIIVVSAPRDERERLAAYDAGADDIVVKPFSLPELLARIRAILRRTSPAIGGRVIRIAGVEMDIDNGTVKRDGIEVRLSLIEFKILRYLMENAGKVRTREQIRNAVWGRDSQIEIRAVDVRITRLRRRLNVENRPDVIRTVRSVGYALGDQQPRQRADTRVDGAEA
jgi:two-component system phosphate regulon response regulator PhoB